MMINGVEVPAFDSKAPVPVSDGVCFRDTPVGKIYAEALHFRDLALIAGYMHDRWKYYGMMQGLIDALYHLGEDSLARELNVESGKILIELEMKGVSK